MTTKGFSPCFKTDYERRSTPFFLPLPPSSRRLSAPFFISDEGDEKSVVFFFFFLSSVLPPCSTAFSALFFIRKQSWIDTDLRSFLFPLLFLPPSPNGGPSLYRTDRPGRPQKQQTLPSPHSPPFPRADRPFPPKGRSLFPFLFPIPPDEEDAQLPFFFFLFPRKKKGYEPADVVLSFPP